ncbi:MAG TPA: response regulator transcription factor [Microbacteriaceae bacterium]|nr:response regulator transcription factor [Microbacteriaceae bacterium]
MIHVLVVDDEPLVRSGVRMILEGEDDIEVVGEAADGNKALERARALAPDVVILDIRMPGMDGIETTRRLLQRADAPRILILTTFDLDEYVYQAMKAGASGFILKNIPPAKLVDAVRTVAEGDALLAPAITRRMIERFVRRAPAGTGRPAQLAELTERELSVLRLIARGLSNAEIASTLFLSEATVKSHVNRVLSKLDLRDRTQATVLAYETGLVEPGDTTPAKP